MNNKELMAEARKALAGKWGLAIGGIVLYIIPFIFLSSGSQTVENPSSGGFDFIQFIISGPMALGLVLFSLNISRGTEAKVSQIFEGFNQFGKAFIAYLLMVLYIILWSLCLVIPGIIAAISYAMTFYILADNPTLSAKEAITASKQMMQGHKMQLFLLGFRFLGWAILCIFTAGIGFFWLMPYVQITMAKFYDDIKPTHAEVPEAA